MVAEDVALAGKRAGRSLREIAIRLYGREQVAGDWHADSPRRAKLRRLLCRAKRDSVRTAPGRTRHERRKR